MNSKQALSIGAGVLGGLTLAAFGGLAARFYLGRRRADQDWEAAQYPKLNNVGRVKKLSILPLIDWYTAHKGLTGEPGVAYLVRAGNTTILFDMGYNAREEHPSPLLRNMKALDVNLNDVDALVLSHAHSDHLGGAKYMAQHTFAPSGEEIDLRGIPAYVPELLANPTARSILVTKPQVIAPGIATIGPIARQLFFLGRTPEQSLAIKVEGKGIVIIIGCGHSTLQRIVDRAEMLFDEPIYGVVGGLHYPVTTSREKIWGAPLQQIFGTGKWPWNPVNRQDVKEAIAYLQRRQPKLVSLSPHDSCDWTLNTFRTAFGEAYQDLLVGQEIVVA